MTRKRSYRYINAQALSRLQLAVDKSTEKLSKAQPGTPQHERRESIYGDLLARLAVMVAQRKDYWDQREAEDAARAAQWTRKGLT